jgi:hypothetical protein
LKLSDEDMNQLATSLQGVDLSRLSAMDLLKVLLRLNPRLFWSLKGLMA